MAKIGFIDQKTQEEEKVLAFYAAHPGMNWVDAAEALGMNEDRVYSISTRLHFYWLDLYEAGRKDGLVAFEARGAVYA